MVNTKILYDVLISDLSSCHLKKFEYIKLYEIINNYMFFYYYYPLYIDTPHIIYIEFLSLYITYERVLI